MTKRVLLYFALLLWFVVPVTAQPTIFIEDLSVESGSNIDLPVKALSFENFVGMQFSINWDPAFLIFDSLTVNDSGVLPEYTVSPSNFNLMNTDQGRLVTLWVNPSTTNITLPDSTTLFTIHYSSIGAPGASSEVEITDTPTAIEVSNEAGQTLDVTVESGTVTVLEGNSIRNLLVQSNQTFTLYQNEPNPFDSQSVIRFDVHEPSEFILEVFDSKGVLVFSKIAHYLVGNQAITIDRNMLPAAGVFVYKLKTKDYFITNRMILVR